MGFELNRIMKQYGVSTPGVVNYSGTAAPGDQPVAPTLTEPVKDSGGVITKALSDLQVKANTDASNKYNTDLAAWNATKSKYDTENAAYNAYKTEYQNRLQNTPMYLQSQFDTGLPKPISEGLAWATRNKVNNTATGEGIGKDAYYDVLRKQAGAATAITDTPEVVAANMKKYGISNQDAYNATGNYWGTQLKAPTFAASAPVTTTAAKPAGLTNQTVYNFNGTPMYQMSTPTGMQWTTYANYNGDVSTLPTYTPSEQGYAHGGQVKTHYQTAGSVDLPDVETYPVTEPAPSNVVITEPKSVLATIANNDMPSAPAVVSNPLAAVEPKPAEVKPAAPKAPAPFGDERMGNIQALLAAYGPKETAYGEDLKAARTAAKAESEAFAKMLSDSMKSPQDEQSSKAEMYFRLAAAFGAPTKTGHFAENLGLVGKELSDYSKEQRASRQQKLALALKGQEMKMTAAKDDLRTLQALTGEEMKDKRAIATELIKDYIKSGEPQSTAGKQALDEGLKPGTPEYQKRVEQIGNMNIEGKLAQINASLAGVTVAQANLALAQNKFENQKTQQAKLSPTEINMKKEAEDTIAIGKQSLADLKQAYALNPNSLAGGWMDKGQQWLAEAAGSKDPTIVNTRILNNLLGSQGLAKLKSTFGGNPTEGERAIMLELEGIGSKTKEERAAIIKRTYKVLQDKQAREQTRLDQINSGAYRSTTPVEGGLE